MDILALLVRAAGLAELGRGEVEPNPRVGAIALCGDEVVGEGWHSFYGGPHAEEQALAAAAARGIAPDGMVVTLEPCSAEGKKRPPCTRLLLDAGVRRVWFGSVDPDPRHQGRGVAALRAAGLAVHGPHESPAMTALLRQFRRGLGLVRPWVIGKWAMTVDGKTATRTGSSRWISGEEALVWAHELRSHCDAVMVGIGTAIADDPELTVRRVTGIHPLRVVVDPDAALPTDSRLLRTAEAGRVLVMVRPDADAARVARLREAGADFLPVAAAKSSLDHRRGLAELRSRGVRRLLVEGGGSLLWELTAAGCVDQVAAVVAPKLCGGREAPTPLEGLGVASIEEAIALAETYGRRIGEDWLVGGFVGGR